MIEVTPLEARRLAITRQRLAGTPPAADREGIMDVLRDIRCLQLDPIQAVARSPLLVLWSRLGPYDPADLRHLLWQERKLFEYWAHAASIVLTEDYPLFRRRMLEQAGNWRPRTEKWLAENDGLREHVLERLDAEGPLAPADFDQNSVVREWHSSGWTNRRTINQMLDILWTEGTIMVAERQGRTRLWAKAEHCLPEWVEQEPLSLAEATRHAVERSLRALGVATARHIREHFTRKSYPGLEQALVDLLAAERIVPVRVTDAEGTWPDEWYVHGEDVPLLAQLQNGAWQPRTTLLSPFDNLICDRQRTEQLFDFYYRMEIYVPQDKREYGYYVLPILHGDRFIGRLDPKLDRKSGRLQVHAVHAEPDAPLDRQTGEAVAAAVESLAEFIGAKEIVYPDDVPAGWQEALRAT